MGIYIGDGKQYINQRKEMLMNFKFTKNLYFQAQYNFVDTKKATATGDSHSNYNQLWALMYVRF